MAVSGPNGGGNGDGFDMEGDGAIFADINITPLTDIFLVLLIIFMVATPALLESNQDSGGLKVTLPKGGQRESVQEVHDIAVAVLTDGRTVIQGKVVDDGALRALFKSAFQSNPETLVLIQADEGVPHGKVVSVMELARGEGLARLAIATQTNAGGP